MDEPTARVEVGPDGKLILIDPIACAVARVVDQHNCLSTVDANADRILHFLDRANQLGKSPKDVVIVIANVDDEAGEILADSLMPGYNWDEIRDRGEVPYARGLAVRDGVLDFAKAVNPELEINENPTAVEVVVLDYGTCIIFNT